MDAVESAFGIFRAVLFVVGIPTMGDLRRRDSRGSRGSNTSAAAALLPFLMIDDRTEQGKDTNASQDQEG